MDEPRDYHKSDRQTNNIMIPLAGSLRKDTNERTYKTETDSQTENKCMVTER